MTNISTTICLGFNLKMLTRVTLYCMGEIQLQDMGELNQPSTHGLQQKSSSLHIFTILYTLMSRNTWNKMPGHQSTYATFLMLQLDNPCARGPPNRQAPRPNEMHPSKDPTACFASDLNTSRLWPSGPWTLTNCYSGFQCPKRPHQVAAWNLHCVSQSLMIANSLTSRVFALLPSRHCSASSPWVKKDRWYRCQQDSQAYRPATVLSTFEFIWQFIPVILYRYDSLRDIFEPTAKSHISLPRVPHHPHPE